MLLLLGLPLDLLFQRLELFLLFSSELNHAGVDLLDLS